MKKRVMESLEEHKREIQCPERHEPVRTPEMTAQVGVRSMQTALPGYGKPDIDGHAAFFMSAAGKGRLQTARLMSAMQHDFGNRYVRRMLALASRDAADASVTPDMESSIQSARGDGQGLDSGIKSRMEPAFNADFSNVRVHTGSRADSLSRALSARAFTSGRDIFFRDGEYNPSSSAGQELLAHELTHVVQQGGGVQGKFEVSSPEDESEQEADAVARAVMSGMTGLQRVETPGFDHEMRRPGRSSDRISSGRPVSRRLQRKLVATGDGNGFATLANSIIAVQYEVLVTPAGVVSIRSTSVQGPPTPAAQELVSVLNTVIGDAKTTTIEFIHGTTSTRASDRSVVGGNYALSRIDLDDIAMAGGSAGRGLTAGTWLAHELQEQYRKQVHGEGYGAAHAAGLASEERASGATITPGNMTQINATTVQWTDIYTYPDGRRESVTVTVTNGNITNVSRRALP